MTERDTMRELRVLVATRDGAGLVARLGSDLAVDSLQLAGDGLLAALADRTEGAPEVAREVAARLRERAWDGDAELAAQLGAALGTGPAPMLRPLPVDLEELAMVLEGDPIQGGGRIDLTTGEVWPQTIFDDGDGIEEGTEDDEDPDRWLDVQSEGSRDGYRDMVLFIEQLDDEEVADRLSIAISGRGAFRRFKDTLSRWPDLMTEFHAFSNERQRGRARAWLAAQGYRPTPSPG